MNNNEMLRKINKSETDIVELNEQLDKIKKNHLKINVKDFGATGEISQDITDIINTIFTTTSGDTLTIIFPTGIYNIENEITLPNKTINFIGDGVEDTIIINNGANTIRSFFYKDSNNTNKFNTIKNIFFNANKKVEKSIFFERGNGTVIKDCKFMNHLQAGIWFECVESMSGAVIYESTISNNYFRGVQGNLGTNNEAIETLPEYNIYFGKGATDSLIRDNVLINAKNHLYINGGNNMIRDNHFFDYPVPQYNSISHIWLNGTSSIIGNYFDSPVCGIKVTGERFFISNNNFFWGNEEIDRSSFKGIDLSLTSDKKRGVVIVNNFFNPIDGALGYDIFVNSELELPLITNNRTMNTTNIYTPIVQYSDGGIRKMLVNGTIEVFNGELLGKITPNTHIIPSATGFNIGSSTNPFQQITTNLSPKCNASNYSLTSFPESIQNGSQEIMTFIKNLGDRVKVLENK